ncbi:MAG TPA: phosphate ABC transporter permease subunit PstC [Balneolales bacterium]|nr:phosphate ABC transporter permease subunit PstC [Balneolales bacterium]
MDHSDIKNISLLSLKEKIFKGLLLFAIVTVILIVVALFLVLIINSWPSLKTFGIKFIYGTTWNPVKDKFGALPFIVGTLLTSFLALIISAPFSLALSLYLGEYFRSGWMSEVLQNAVELLAGIPSVIYGFWGLFVLVPIIRSVEMELGAPPYGLGVLASSIILAVMIIPYSASVSREVISLVPGNLKEAAYSLGATRYEVIKKVIIPYTWSGILAGIILALGRALGETMAVTMVIGNTNNLPTSIFSTGNTMASVIANEFTEASGNLYLSSLIEIGLILFLITMVINFIGKRITKRYSL